MIDFQPMRLVTAESPALALTWTILHPIGADSPLFNLTEQTLRNSETNFVVSIAGFDEASAQTIHVRAVYAGEDLRFGYEYEDVIWTDSHGLRHVDYAKIDAIQPDSMSPS